MAAARALPQRLLWASTSAKSPGLPDSYYLARLVDPDTADIVPEETLLAFADHGSFDALLETDEVGAQATIGAVASAGVDVGGLADSLQRQGAKAVSAEWSALVDAIGVKIAGM